MESLDMKRAVICIFLMALVTNVPRVLPLTVFRKQIRSRYIRSFLDYTPYAVLGAMTFPDVFTSTGNLVSALQNGDGVCPELLQEGTGDGGLLCHLVVYIVELLL